MNATGVNMPQAKRKVSKRTPMGTTPEDFLDDLKRVYAMQKEIGVEIYRKHGKYSEGMITRKFGTWNRALSLACLPIRYQTSKTEELLGETTVKTKRSVYPCWKCHQPFKGLGRRKGNWHCESCTESINAQAASMGWMAC